MNQTISNDYINMINKKGSGYNIPVIVDAIVNAEIDPIRTQVTAKIEATDATISGLGSLKSSAQTSKTMTDAFKADLNYSLTSTNTTSLTITSKDDGELVSFSKEILAARLARSMTLTIPNYNSNAVFGTPQTLTVRGGNPAAVMGTIAVVALETVGSVAAKLNSIAGISATLVDDGSGSLTPHTLSISGALGFDNNFTIASTDVGNKINAQAGDGRIRPAANASLIIDGVAVQRPTNTLSDVIDGATINLLKDDMGPITVAATLSSSGVMATVKELMVELNRYKADLDALGFVDTVGDADGALATNSYLKSAHTQFTRFMAAPLMGYAVNGVENVPVYFIEFGIRTTRNGTYEFDKLAFDKTFAREPEKFAALAVDRAYSSDPNVLVTATTSSTVPTGAHVFTNGVRYSQLPGSANVGGFRSDNDIVRAQTIRWQVETHGAGSYFTDGTQTLAELRNALNGAANDAPNAAISIGANISTENNAPAPSTRRLNITWAMPSRPTSPRPGTEQGDALTLTGTPALSNEVTQVIGVPEIHQYNGFASTTGDIPGQTLSITVAGVTRSITHPTAVPEIHQYNGFPNPPAVIPGQTINITVDGVTTTINQPVNQTVSDLAAKFNAINGLSAAVVADGSGGSALKFTGPSDGADISNPSINNGSSSSTGSAIQTRVAAESVTQLAARFNAINGLSAAVVADGSGGFGLKLTGPSNGADISNPSINNGSSSSTGAAIQTRVDAVAFVANSVGAINTVPPRDEFYQDELGNLLAIRDLNGAGVYDSPDISGFQFVTDKDQLDMAIYVARSAKTELSRFFKDALSTTGIYRTVVDAYTEEGTTLAKRLDTIDERKLTLQARYTQQFAAMEKVVTGGSSTSEFLTNMVASWNKD